MYYNLFYSQNFLLYACRGAGKKGFGNAREVRNRLERCITEQSERLGTLDLYGKHISPSDYAILNRAGVVN